MIEQIGFVMKVHSHRASTSTTNVQIYRSNVHRCYLVSQYGLSHPMPPLLTDHLAQV